jgi:hypothetical protein
MLKILGIACLPTCGAVSSIIIWLTLLLWSMIWEDEIT